MKLIIDIPEDLYKWIKDEYDNPNEEVAYSAIEKGIPYEPKGDLISRNEAEKLGATCLAKRNENGQLEAIISLDNAPTVSFMISPDYVTELQNRNKELIRQLEEAERPQDKLIHSLTELCNRYCENCPITYAPNDCTDCICTHIRGIIGGAE